MLISIQKASGPPPAGARGPIRRGGVAMPLSCRLSLLVLAGLALLLAADPVGSKPAQAGKYEKFWLYVGTYTPKGGPSKGIYRLELDLATGKLSQPEVAAETVDP